MLVASWKRMKVGWWNDAGYETYWDVVQAEDARWERVGLWKRRKRPRVQELPDDALRGAADSFGLSPTTLARLLIHRGAIAVLEEQRSS